VVATIPTNTALIIGSAYNSTAQLNSHIKRLDYYASRKTDAELQVLST
jgi:hypothetical protein